MIKLLIIIVAFLKLNDVSTESIYTYSVPSIEGVNKPMAAYQGKKLLIITLPTVQNSANDSLLHSIDSLNTAYAGNLVIIGTPSYEDGFTPSIKSSLQTWYRSILSNDIVITDGLYTHKTSGTQQHPLFRWLTDKDKNGHFNQDIIEVKAKFVVWTDGELIGVLNGQTKVGGVTMNDLLQN